MYINVAHITGIKKSEFKGAGLSWPFFDCIDLLKMKSLEWRYLFSKIVQF